MLRREFLIGTISITTFPTSVLASSDALIVDRTEKLAVVAARGSRALTLQV